MPTGQCHCGAIRYEMPATFQHHAICHCSDCRRHAGAPMVAWALIGADELKVTGDPVVYASSEHGRRHFCGRCGTGLFYTNEAIFPGKVDVQSATLDDPDALAAPFGHIQMAERIGWMDGAEALPKFDRYPG
ncbi:GFA family protein [Sphingomonas sp. CJ99]